MPESMSFITRVDDHGHLPEHRRDQIDTYLTLFAGGQVQIKIGKPTRSLSQNAFYHGFVIRPIHQAMISAGLGPISHEALHAYFRDKYLSAKVETVFGEEKVIPPTTTELDSTEFHYFVQSVKTDEIVRQLGVEFPEREYELA